MLLMGLLGRLSARQRQRFAGFVGPLVLRLSKRTERNFDSLACAEFSKSIAAVTTLGFMSRCRQERWLTKR